MGKVRITANFSRNFSLLSFSKLYSCCKFQPYHFPRYFLVREFIELLLLYITSMVSAWLADGLLPDWQKHAIVSPLPKKPGLNVVDIANYRPVSNLTFVSNVIEQAVASQLYEYLVANDLLPRYQSAYRTEAFNRNRHATCLVSGRTYWQPPTDASSLCLAFLTCRRRSIVLTRTFYCSNFRSVLACRMFCCGGFGYSWPLMTTISQAAEVGAVTCVSELTDLSQNDHWTDGSRPVCGDKVLWSPLEWSFHNDVSLQYVVI